MKTYCIFTAHYLPIVGGVERYSYNLAKHLAGAGNKVFIVTSNSMNISELESDSGVKIYRFPCFNLLKGRFPFIKINRRFRALYNQLLMESIDYVIVNTRFYPHSLFGVWFGAKIGVRTVVIEHGTSHFTINSKLLDCVGHLYEHGITFLIKRYTTEFYGVSEACSHWLEHFKIKTSGIFYNAVDLDEIAELKKTTSLSFRNEHGINESDIVVVYTGRLIREKGVMKLIDAVSTLVSSGTPLFLLIAGDGELRSEVESKRSKNIIPLGVLDFPSVIALLNQSDIFCLPTDYAEGFPTSIIEAAACHCYCISTTKGGSKELIVSEKHGYILQDNTTDEIVSSLLYATSNPEYRKEAAKNAYDRVSQLFSWRTVFQKIIETFQSEVDK